MKNKNCQTWDSANRYWWKRWVITIPTTKIEICSWVHWNSISYVAVGFVVPQAGKTINKKKSPRLFLNPIRTSYLSIGMNSSILTWPVKNRLRTGSTPNLQKTQINTELRTRPHRFRVYKFNTDNLCVTGVPLKITTQSENGHLFCE